jgi:hypothetical protein
VLERLVGCHGQGLLFHVVSSVGLSIPSITFKQLYRLLVQRCLKSIEQAFLTNNLNRFYFRNQKNNRSQSQYWRGSGLGLRKW